MNWLDALRREAEILQGEWRGAGTGLEYIGAKRAIEEMLIIAARVESQGPEKPGEHLRLLMEAAAKHCRNVCHWASQATPGEHSACSVCPLAPFTLDVDAGGVDEEVPVPARDARAEAAEVLERMRQAGTDTMAARPEPPPPKTRSLS